MHKSKYTNDSFERSIASFYKLCSKISKELFRRKTKFRQKKTINFHIQFLFQAASESYPIQRAANNNALTILGLFRSYCECTVKKKSDN